MAPKKGARTSKGKQPASKRVEAVPVPGRQPPNKRPILIPAPVPVGTAQLAGVPGASTGAISPALLEAFWDSLVSRIILDRLAGIEWCLDETSTSLQPAMSSLEFFQFQVLSCLSVIESQCVGAPSQAVASVGSKARPVQREVGTMERRGEDQQVAIRDVPSEVSGKLMATQTHDITWPWGLVDLQASMGSPVSMPEGAPLPRVVNTPVPSNSVGAAQAQPVAVGVTPSSTVMDPSVGDGLLSSLLS
ncbi:UNVERIFIED_CONTAM: hypothetical protein K2H54_051680 [Gekko kuhli]